MNLYEILGVNRYASRDQIKSAYRTLAKQYHPDKTGDNSNVDRFHAIKTAYDVLSDEAKRSQYDIFGLSDDAPQNAFSSIINNICSSLFSGTEIFGHLKKDKTFNDLLTKNDHEMATDYVINSLRSHFSFGNNEDNSDPSEYESCCSESIVPDQMDIVVTLKTTYGQIYEGNVKVVTIERQVLKGKKMVVETANFSVPACNDITVFENEGNEYIDDTDNLVKSNVIIKILCKKSEYYKRINTNDIMIMSAITNDEFESGYVKTLKYFNKIITVKCKNPSEKIRNGMIITVISGHGPKYFENNDFTNPLYGDVYVVFVKKK